jgi:hypothetical protein
VGGNRILENACEWGLALLRGESWAVWADGVRRLRGLLISICSRDEERGVVARSRQPGAGEPEDLGRITVVCGGIARPGRFTIRRGLGLGLFCGTKREGGDFVRILKKGWGEAQRFRNEHFGLRGRCSPGPFAI